MISVDNELCYLGFEQFDFTTVIQSDVAYAASAEFSAGEYQKIIDSGTNVSVETERMVDRIDPSQRITITAFNGSRSSTLGTILDPIAAVKNRFGHQIFDQVAAGARREGCPSCPTLCERDGIAWV